MLDFHKTIGVYISSLCTAVAVGLWLEESRPEGGQYVEVNPVAVADFTADNRTDILYKTVDSDGNDVLSLVMWKNTGRSKGRYFVNDLGKPVLVMPPGQRITKVEAGNFDDDNYTDIKVDVEVTQGESALIDGDDDGSIDIKLEGCSRIQSTYLGNGRGGLNWNRADAVFKNPENAAENEKPNNNDTEPEKLNAKSDSTGP